MASTPMTTKTSWNMAMMAAVPYRKECSTPRKAYQMYSRMATAAMRMARPAARVTSAPMDGETEVKFCTVTAAPDFSCMAATSFALVGSSICAERMENEASPSGCTTGSEIGCLAVENWLYRDVISATEGRWPANWT